MYDEATVIMASSYFFLKVISEKRIKKSLTTHNDSVENRLPNSVGTSLKKLCRVCMNLGSIPIFTENSTTDISEQVKCFGDILVDQDDELPKVLCKSCYSLLNGAILFRKLAKESELILVNKRQSRDLLPETCKEIMNNIDEHSDIKYEKSNNIDYSPYTCKVCNLNFRTYDEYFSHNSSKHHRNMRVQCPICHSLLSTHLYQKHVARHQAASHLVCDVCGKLYRKDNLVRHLQLHSYNLPYQCKLCPYRGRFIESLKIHIRTHSGEKPFSCEKCDLKLLTRSNLNRHLLTHKKEKPFKCLECHRSFYTKRDADVHFKSDHGIKDFNCALCGNKYGTRKAMMRHELRVHKRDKLTKGCVPLYLQTKFIK